MSNPARTGTQKALHVVSIIMIVLGVLVILSGASLIALGVSAATMGMDQPMTLGDTETTADTTSVALGIHRPRHGLGSARRRRIRPARLQGRKQDRAV